MQTIKLVCALELWLMTALLHNMKAGVGNIVAELFTNRWWQCFAPGFRVALALACLPGMMGCRPCPTPVENFVSEYFFTFQTIY
jgi:hypothetical protein